MSVQPADLNDPALVTEVDLARAAAQQEAGDERVGGHVSYHVEDEAAVTHLFEAEKPGYHGWRWAVTITSAGPDTDVTVSEVVLLPGPAALVAPDWVPWQQRVRAGDLGVGDLLPTAPDDPRLVPAYLESDDPAVEDVALEAGLGRARVMARPARLDAAARWHQSEFGPRSDMARSAPAHCGTCGFYLPLAGALRAAFGTCGNELSPADGHVVHAEYGCGAHSEAEVEQVSPVLVADLIYDDAQLDIEPADGTPQPAGEATAEPTPEPPSSAGPTHPESPEADAVAATEQPPVADPPVVAEPPGGVEAPPAAEPSAEVESAAVAGSAGEVEQAADTGSSPVAESSVEAEPSVAESSPAEVGQVAEPGPSPVAEPPAEVVQPAEAESSAVAEPSSVAEQRAAVAGPSAEEAPPPVAESPAAAGLPADVESSAETESPVVADSSADVEQVAAGPSPAGEPSAEAERAAVAGPSAEAESSVEVALPAVTEPPAEVASPVADVRPSESPPGDSPAARSATPSASSENVSPDAVTSPAGPSLVDQERSAISSPGSSPAASAAADAGSGAQAGGTAPASDQLVAFPEIGSPAPASEVAETAETTEPVTLDADQLAAFPEIGGAPAIWDEPTPDEPAAPDEEGGARPAAGLTGAEDTEPVVTREPAPGDDET